MLPEGDEVRVERGRERRVEAVSVYFLLEQLRCAVYVAPDDLVGLQPVLVLELVFVGNVEDQREQDDHDPHH